MKSGIFFAAALILAMAASLPSQAQTPTNHPAAREHRYLLIVETSKAMGKRSEGISHTVLDIIGSGLKGQIKRGDTLGLWMFNESLITGKLPLQKWNSDNQSKVATTIVEFLDKQKFEKAGLPETFLPTLSRVITNSPLITVILVSSGNTDLRGTGFDDKINATYKQWREQQQQKKMPFVTLFRARNGALTDYAVSPAPWPAELPPLPPEPVAQTKPARPATQAQAPAPRPTTNTPGALYFSGKKPELQSPPKPMPVTTAATQASTQTNEPKLPTIVVSETNTNTAAAGGASGTNAPSSEGTAPEQKMAMSLVENNPALRQNHAPVANPAVQPGGGGRQGNSAVVEPSPSGSQAAAQSNTNSKQASTVETNRMALAPALSGETEKATAVPVPALKTPPAAPQTPGRRFPTDIIAVGLLCCLVTALVVIYVPRMMRSRARHAEHVSLITRSLDRSTR